MMVPLPVPRSSRIAAAASAPARQMGSPAVKAAVKPVRCLSPESEGFFESGQAQAVLSLP